MLFRSIGGPMWSNKFEKHWVKQLGLLYYRAFQHIQWVKTSWQALREGIACMQHSSNLLAHGTCFPQAAYFGTSVLQVTRWDTRKPHCTGYWDGEVTGFACSLSRWWGEDRITTIRGYNQCSATWTKFWGHLSAMLTEHRLNKLS